MCILLRRDWRKWQGRAQNKERSGSPLKGQGSIGALLCSASPQGSASWGKSPSRPREKTFKIMQGYVCVYLMCMASHCLTN